MREPIDFENGSIINTWEILELTNARGKGRRWLVRCTRCGNECIRRCDTIRLHKHLCPGRTEKQQVLAYYKANAKRRGYNWELTDKQALDLMQWPCLYCGQEPNTVQKARNANTVYEESRWFIHNGLDRMDNDLGYTVDNTVPCCSFCNFVKNNTPTNEWFGFLDRVQTNWRGGRKVDMEFA